MINGLDFAYSPISSNRLSIPDEMSGDLQNDFLDGDYHHDS
jgi:hypothetical protein